MRDTWVAETGPGRFEGQHPMVPFLCLSDIEPDEWGGDVSIGGCFDLYGRWVLRQDELGFVTGVKFATKAEALDAFEQGYALSSPGWDA